MRVFIPVQLQNEIKPHENLEHSYSWKKRILEFQKKPANASEFRYLNVVDITSFDNAFMSEVAATLLPSTVFEVDVDDPVERSPDVALLWPAVVKKVCGYRMLMRFVDDAEDGSNDFWVNMCSATVHRVGYANELKDEAIIYAIPANFPDSYEPNMERISNFLTSCVTPPRTFEILKRSITRTTLQVGQRVELLDNNVSTRVRPATVISACGMRVCIKVGEDYDEENDPESEEIQEERQANGEFWCDHDSFYIFHVGWAAYNGYGLCAKPEYVEHSKNIAECLKKNADAPYVVKDVHREALNGSKSEKHGFKAGMKLEFLDPLDSSFNKLKVGSVVKVLKDGYITIGPEGDDIENETIPFHCSSNFLFPAGYAKKYKIPIVPPGEENTTMNFDWDGYLEASGSVAAPESLFPPVPNLEDMKRRFPIGASLEASDLNETYLICPAHVAKIKGRLIEVAYDGWDSDYNQLFDHRSHDIFPVGWCESHGYKLEYPQGEKATKKR